MRTLRFAACALVVVVVWSAAPADAQPRSLHWRELQVAAELDADGRLHVRERHVMVFNGDWNGGERRFDLRKGQSLIFHHLARVGPGAGVHELRPGDPPGVDEFTWADSRTLRWRSRAPSDPPFEATEIVYDIDYTLSGIVTFRDGVYELDHDFAFGDRAGPINRFVLDLRLDRNWRPPAGVAPRATAGPLLPGTGFPVRVALTHLGAAAPAHVDHGSPGLRRGLLVFFALAVLLRLAWFWFGEWRAGRLEALTPVDRIDGRWLEQNVFHVPAEVVGATWDRSVGAPEVAATLARLEAESRIETWPDDDDEEVRHLRLLVPREALVPHERLLLDALLVGGGDATDTRAVKQHYKATGFDPAGVIGKVLEERVRELLGSERRGAAGRWIPTALLTVAGLAALAWALVSEGDGLALLAVIPVLIAYLVGLPIALRWRRRVDGGVVAACGLLVPIVLLFGAVGFVNFAEPRVGVAALGGTVALALAFLHSLLNQAAARESLAALRLRKRLTAARRFLRRELRQRSARVQEAWFPHLLALGLTEEADRWSAARPSAPAAPTSWTGAGGTGTSGGSQAPGFSGGGGRFGGGGASGSWAATAQAFSASIASPSSSGSSGSSGGSSSSSSGGGGGGGW